MARLRRDGPYFWVTWLTKLLSRGELVRMGDLVQGPPRERQLGAGPRGLRPGRVADGPHGDGQRGPRPLGGTGLSPGLHREAEQPETQGRIRHLGGQPDLIARKGDAGTIIDVKTGKPGVAHIVQVMLYMYAVPRAIGQHQVTWSSTARWPTPTTPWIYRPRRWMTSLSNASRS